MPHGSKRWQACATASHSALRNGWASSGQRISSIRASRLLVITLPSTPWMMQYLHILMTHVGRAASSRDGAAPVGSAIGKRIIVVGSSGSGKSTLGEQLAARLDVPFIELDALYWEPGWVEAEREV